MRRGERHRQGIPRGPAAATCSRAPTGAAMLGMAGIAGGGRSRGGGRTGRAGPGRQERADPSIDRPLVLREVLADRRVHQDRQGPGLHQHRAGAGEVLPAAQGGRAHQRDRPDRHEPRPAVRQGLQQPEVLGPGDQGHPRGDRRLRRVRLQEGDLLHRIQAKTSPTTSAPKNCVEGFKKIVGHAEKKGVTLCLEMLNSRVSSHPMKGHPGYQGDHTDYCIDIIKRVGSPSLKLLFDIYHVQIMDGDIITPAPPVQGVHRPHPHRRQPRPRRARREPGDLLPADHEGARRDRLRRPRRPRVHPHPRPARGPSPGDHALRRLTA